MSAIKYRDPETGEWKTIPGGGSAGVAGKDGATFVPAVSEDGTLSWTNDKGLDNPVPVNIMGPRGENGPTGPQGAQGPQGEPGPKGDTGNAGIGVISIKITEV